MSTSVTAATFDREVLTNDGPVLVDFWAPWCAPCHAVAPVLDQLAAEHQIKLVKVNFDEEPELADRYGIQAIPNMVMFRNGRPVAQALGARPKPALAAALGLSSSV